MSLDFRVTDIKDYETVCKDDTGAWRPVTEALVFMALGIGVPKITLATAGEFYGRMNVVERVNGAMLVGPEGPIYLSREDVEAHVGLSTNAVPLTRPQFMKRLMQEVDDRRGYYERWVSRKGHTTQAAA